MLGFEVNGNVCEVSGGKGSSVAGVEERKEIGKEGFVGEG